MSFFRSLGIDAQVERVYLAIMESPDAAVSDIAVSIREDEETVQRALDVLAEMSLVTFQDRRSGASAIDPELGLSALLARQRADIAERQRRHEESRLAIATLLTRFSARRSPDDVDVEQLRGTDVIEDRISEIVDECRSDIVSFGRPGVGLQRGIDATRSSGERAQGRGIRLRSILLDSLRNEESSLTYARELTDLGTEIRTLPSLPIRMIVADRRVAVMSASSLECGRDVIVIRGRVLAEALFALFTSHWREAVPWTLTRPRRNDELSLQERHVIKLWSQGKTDDSVARHLEVSVRTIRRLAENLSRRLGSHSRFQLGASATARGWIRSDDLG